MDGLDSGGFCWLPCIYAHCAIGENIRVHKSWCGIRERLYAKTNFLYFICAIGSK